MVLGINVGEGLEKAKQFREEFGIGFPILIDKHRAVYGKYSQPGITPFPLDYIIDASGRIRYFNTEYRPRRMKEVIESLLADPATAVHGDERGSLPEEVHLAPVFPNPVSLEELSRSGVSLSFRLKRRERVTIDVFNLLGQRVATLADGVFSPGSHRIRWPGKVGGRFALPAGVYLIALRAGTVRRTQKLLILR